MKTMRAGYPLVPETPSVASPLNALALLESQHHEVERLFAQIDKAATRDDAAARPRRNEKHEGLKRIVAHLLVSADSETFEAKLKVLKDLTAGRRGPLG